MAWWEYQTDKLVCSANSRMASRYARTVAVTAVRRCLVEWPLSRPAISTLVESLLTSHSKGPGLVSSKSLTSKTRRRSGEANRPKLLRCASPHS